MADTNAKLQDDLDKLRKDVSQLTKDLQTMATERGRDAYNAAREVGQGAYDTAVSAGTEAQAYARNQINAHPFTSVLTAFGVGLVLGKLMNGRH